jgi:hypothetical protein
MRLALLVAARQFINVKHANKAGPLTLQVVVNAHPTTLNKPVSVYASNLIFKLTIPATQES